MRTAKLRFCGSRSGRGPNKNQGFQEFGASGIVARTEGRTVGGFLGILNVVLEELGPIR